MSTMEQKLADQKHEQRNHRTEEISAHGYTYVHKYEKNRDGVRIRLCGPISCNKHTHKRKKRNRFLATTRVTKNAPYKRDGWWNTPRVCEKKGYYRIVNHPVNARRKNCQIFLLFLFILFYFILAFVFVFVFICIRFPIWRLPLLADTDVRVLNQWMNEYMGLYYVFVLIDCLAFYLAFSLRCVLATVCTLRVGEPYFCATSYDSLIGLMCALCICFLFLSFCYCW